MVDLYCTSNRGNSVSSLGLAYDCNTGCFGGGGFFDEHLCVTLLLFYIITNL